jgi:hypothetical protein
MSEVNQESLKNIQGFNCFPYCAVTFNGTVVNVVQKCNVLERNLLKIEEIYTIEFQILVM